MTCTPDDARYRPRPGDTRTLGSTARVVTRATDWAVEAEIPDARDPAATRIVLSMGDWSSGHAAFVWTPKARTAEDARFDPLPDDVCRTGGVDFQVTARNGDRVSVAVVWPDGTPVHADVWSVEFWSSAWDDGGPDVWVAG